MQRPAAVFQQPQYFAWTSSPDNDKDTIVLDRDYLRSRTSWIRDDLDPLVAQRGPDSLTADTVITLFTFFEELRKASLSHQTLRCSRVHFALLEISGRATRWPSKLIEIVDSLIQYWTSIYGTLADIRPLLYEDGGRLYGISTPEDLEREKLLIKWLRSAGTHVSPTIARRHGDLGFKPGECVVTFFFCPFPPFMCSPFLFYLYPNSDPAPVPLTLSPQLVDQCHVRLSCWNH